MVSFVVLSENRGTGELGGESGLSIYLEVEDQKLLLDTGYSSLFMENSNKLGINIDDINIVVLTHGHSDHTNGVPYLKSGKTIIIHPEGFKPRWSIRKKEFAGFPLSYDELSAKHNVVLSENAVEVIKDVFFLGHIPMLIDFEKGNFSTTLDEKLTKTDLIEDDSGIAIKTDNGLVIMTGCGHRGICNTIERAKKVTGEEKVYAVLGGFHLRNLEKQKEVIDETIKYFEKENIKHLYLGHCVTDEVIEYFKNNVNNIEIHNLFVGAKFDISNRLQKSL